MSDDVQTLQHFSFESYIPNSYTSQGVPVVERIHVQMTGKDLSIYDVIERFENFLCASGYAAILKDKCLDLVDRS